MKEKKIISAALTGNWGTKEISPAIPMTPKEIAEGAYECYRAGASIVHLHMRDDQMRPTMDVGRFKETIGLIRDKCDIIINITSSGDHTVDSIGDDNVRIAPFRELDPEMGSYDCGTMNWMHSCVFSNPPDFLEKLGKTMLEYRVKPELEIFDGGMIYTTLHYLKKGIIKPPLHYQFILGAPGGMDATVSNLVYLRSLLPEGCTWSAAGLGKGHMPIMLCTLAMGGHVRVGLEDNVYFEKNVLAESNAQLVERAARIIADIGQEPATSSEAREILGIVKLRSEI